MYRQLDPIPDNFRLPPFILGVDVSVPPTYDNYAARCVEVRLNDFRSTNSFSLIRDEDDLPMQEMNRQLHEFYSNLSSDEGLLKFDHNDVSTMIGRLCIAKFAEDGKYYRAMIIGVCDDKRVAIRYIDFGRKKIVNIEMLRIFDRRFAQLPPLAFEARFTPHQLTENKSANEIIKLVVMLCNNVELQAFIRNYDEQEKQYVVELFRSVPNADNEDDVVLDVLQKHGYLMQIDDSYPIQTVAETNSFAIGDNAAGEIEKSTNSIAPIEDKHEGTSANTDGQKVNVLSAAGDNNGKAKDFVNGTDKIDEAINTNKLTDTRYFDATAFNNNQPDFVELLRNVRAAPDLENSKQMMIGVMNAFRYIQKLKAEASNHTEDPHDFDNLLEEMKMFRKAVIALKTAMAEFGIDASMMK